MQTTWKPYEKHGELTERSDLPDSVFAFPKQRKEPMTDASHVRNAIARFDQTIDVSDEDRKLAFANIKKAAKAARRKKTIKHLPKRVRTALGKQGSKAARKRRR